MVFDWLKRMMGFSSGANGSDGPVGGPGGATGAPSEAPGMLACHEALERLYEYLDGELEEGEAASVAHHFEICAACYPKLTFEQSFLDALERARAGTETPEPLKNRVLEALEKEGFIPSGAE